MPRSKTTKLNVHLSVDFGEEEFEKLTCLGPGTLPVCGVVLFARILGVCGVLLRKYRGRPALAPSRPGDSASGKDDSLKWQVRLVAHRFLALKRASYFVLTPA